ncbi:transposase [Oscillatoria salina]|uniref:transposase n=1 Tax=Oscillatoria salina TaxID=331517 RepID=UPI0013B7ADFA|nr:transposase [Oscillatoria salina]MBZ8178971.1 transposase [Oscillatoria salina IIICB1]NET88180.1 transposase [Kamptonema sp. SIO1D9]
MIVFEFKVKAKQTQYVAIDETLRTAQFVRNQCLQYWIDNRGINKYDLNKYCAVLAKEFSFAQELNSQAKQASAERTWCAISPFSANCRQKVKGKKGGTRFKQNSHSAEYKSIDSQLSENQKTVNFADKKEKEKLKYQETDDLNFFRGRIVKV